MKARGLLPPDFDILGAIGLSVQPNLDVWKPLTTVQLMWAWLGALYELAFTSQGIIQGLPELGSATNPDLLAPNWSCRGLVPVSFEQCLL
jgi:hypothetical protein